MSNSSATPWTVTHQASLSMGFPRQEYWSGLPFPSPGDLPDPGIKPVSAALQAASSSLHHLGRQTSNSTSQFWMLQELQKKKIPSYKPNLCFLKVKVKITQLCPVLCDPMDYTVHGILQARMLEWVAYSFSRGSSRPRDGTQVSRIAGGFFTS